MIPVILLVMITWGTHSSGVNVTFRVDMSMQTVPPEGVHIAGSFQGWDPGATLMAPAANNIYEYAQDFQAGEMLEYKFINGDEWGEDESVPPACAQNNNRYLTVPAEDTLLVAVCFGSCNPCSTPVSITFQVDMSEQTVSPNGVHIAGSFQGWNPGSTEMTDMGNGLYAHTAIVSAGDYIEFKYINGTEWSGEEQVPAACGVSNGMGGYNRFLTVPNANTTLNVVCFSSCYPCGYVPVEVEVTFRVDMSEVTVAPEGVHLAGSFQGWDPSSTLLTDLGSGVYGITLNMWSGEYHEYKFINGITWDSVETVPQECGVDDGQGGYNRFIVIPETDTTLTAVCYGSCDPCSTTGIQSPRKNSTGITITPNPSNGQAQIRFSLTEQSHVTIVIIDITGQLLRKVMEKDCTKGTHLVTLNESGLGCGLYLCQMIISGHSATTAETARLAIF